MAKQSKKQGSAPPRDPSLPAIGKGGVSKQTEVMSNGRRDIGVGNPNTGLATKPFNALTATYDDAIRQYQEHIGLAFQGLSAAIAMKDLTPPQLAQAFAFTKSTEDLAKEAAKLARARNLDILLTQGLPVGEKGLSREVDLGNGRYIRATIQKSGTDPVKFEAALRAKDVPVKKYMETVEKYTLKPGTASQDAALADGVFTADELKAMDHDPDYRVDRPKERKAGGES